MNTHVDLFLDKAWKKWRKKFKTDDVGKNQFVTSLYSEATRVATESIPLLNPWLAILDEGIFWLDLHGKYLQKAQSTNKTQAMAAIVGLAHKLEGDALAARLLIMHGYRESANVLFRTFLEATNLVLILATHKELADDYAEDFFGREQDQFWNKHLRGGKAKSLLKETLKAISLKDEDIESYGADVALHLGMASKAVHSSASTSMGALFQPSLKSPGLYHVAAYGRIAADSPLLIQTLYDAIGNYAYWFIGLIIANAQELPLASNDTFAQFQQLAARHNTFQEVRELYRNDATRLMKRLKLT